MPSGSIFQSNGRPTIWNLKHYIVFSILCILQAFESRFDEDGFIVGGWVQQLRQHVYEHDGKKRFVVLSRIRDSKAARTKSWNAWFVAEKTGEIVASHCNCTTGYEVLHYWFLWMTNAITICTYPVMHLPWATYNCA